MSCSLCDKGSFKFYITFCRTHSSEILLVSTEHKDNFSKEETREIERMFPNRKIRWEMASIKSHAHAHVEDVL